MARNRKRKTNIGTFTQEHMKEAVRLVLHENLPIRRAAELQGVAYVTLFRYVRKVKANPDSDVAFRPNYNVRLIFTQDDEKTLVDYLLTSAKMCYGLTPLECRKLAYEAAVKNNKDIPKKWKEEKIAGREWYLGFRKRHPELSCRKPESCSLSRSTSFNRHNVSTFFKNLEVVLNREVRFRDGSRVFNLDETGTTTVQVSPKILAKKGMKQVSQCTSGERGVLVTTCSIICAAGHALPPAMVFPRVHFKEVMIKDAPVGTLGLATPSGWMNRELFPQVMKHFIRYSFSSPNNPSLLILDNHESHLSMESLDLAKSNGVTILTLPPHCSNKLQPLDVSVFSSFKAHYNHAIQSWLLNHPGIPVNIFNIGSFVKVAHERSMTPTNIISGFKKTGIFPFDSDIFTEDDFLMSSVTDRPEDHSGPSTIDETQSEIEKEPQNMEVNTNSSIFLTPHVFRGFPKAQKRKIQISRKQGKTIIATDTPEKNALAERQLCRMKVKSATVKKVTRKILDDSEDEEQARQESLSDSEPEEPIPDFDEELSRKPIENDFVLVQFKTKNLVHFVGKVLNVLANDEFEVSYMRKSAKVTGKFFFPAIGDISVVKLADIKKVLPHPILSGSTSRQKSYMSFEVNFGNLDIR